MQINVIRNGLFVFVENFVCFLFSVYFSIYREMWNGGYRLQITLSLDCFKSKYCEIAHHKKSQP